MGDEEEFISAVSRFLSDEKAFAHSSVASRDFVHNNAGATEKIVQELLRVLPAATLKK